ncbi:MAG TPA: helicase HerA-like domain-containing protein [Rhizobiaceae bacterium]|nr:helicase HerA-like domain-containing protein [Rhizobiaceae bacterium]
MNTAIAIGRTVDGRDISLPLALGNRHGLVTGATGTGKTVTLQRLAEEFSRAGVPVFAADVKGDLSGIAAKGDPQGKAASRAESLLSPWTPDSCPACFWDIFGVHGLPIRTSVHALGPELLASMLRLNETQYGTLAIAFRKARDEQDFLLTLDDLRWALNDMMEFREEVCKRYGNITASSIAAIQRNILALEAQGGHHLFGEPAFNVQDFIRTEDGRGVVNLLHADDLMEAPKLYATFLLWLLTELFRALPEAGDLDKPKLVFFFDEAHLLFRDAPKPLLQQIERLVRLVRSKGVGVFFVTQTPQDVPETVLAQLGTRIQHALRAFTVRDQARVRAAADAFRPNPQVNARAAITSMAIGEALVSVLSADGTPSPVERVMIYPPAGQIGPISELERKALIDQSQLRQKYAATKASSEANRSFIDRMRAERGLPAIAWSEEEWKPGDYAQFLPDFTPAPSVERRRGDPNAGWKAIVALAVAAVLLAVAV